MFFPKTQNMKNHFIPQRTCFALEFSCIFLCFLWNQTQKPKFCFPKHNQTHISKPRFYYAF